MYYVLKIISCLPWAVLRWLARSIAVLLYCLDSSMKRISAINLKLVYPQLSSRQHQTLLRNTLRSQCLTYIESIKIWGMPARHNRRLIETVYGEQHLTQALANPKGTIIVLAHLGNWELVNVWLNQHAAPMIMYKPSKNKGVNRFMLKARQSAQATLVPTDDRGVRAVFKHLKQGGVTVILPDHLPKASGGIYANFFGQHTLCTTLLPKLAQKTQCQVLGVHCLRNAQGLFDLHCNVLSTQIGSQDLDVSVSEVNHALEHMIAQSPEQYTWSYKRFRHMPSHPQLYKRASGSKA